MNPKYKGQGSYGRYRKVERLFDVNDPAAGNVTRMAPAPASEVIETDGIVAPIVSETVWRQSADRSRAGHSRTSTRSAPAFSLRPAWAHRLWPVRQEDARPHGQAEERRQSASATSASTGPTTPATTAIPRLSFWLRTGFCPRSISGWRI